MKSEKSSATSCTVQDLNGKLLLAHPRNPDDVLARAVILVASADTDRVIGLQINHIYPELYLDDVCTRLGIDYSDSVPVYRGGDQGSRRIHVIHNESWSGLTTLNINSEISITNDVSVLAALSAGTGPEKFRACAGHWNWSANSLERQIRDASSVYRWIPISLDCDNIFDMDPQDQWRECIEIYLRNSIGSWTAGFRI